MAYDASAANSPKIFRRQFGRSYDQEKVWNKCRRKNTKLYFNHRGKDGPLGRALANRGGNQKPRDLGRENEPNYLSRFIDRAKPTLSIGIVIV